MPYHKMLQKIIRRQNLPNCEIIRLCKEQYNIPINPDHFSHVLNGHKAPFKIETSRAIAKICNADERLLVLETYFDKAPKEIQEVFTRLKNTIIYFGNNFIQNQLSRADYKIIAQALQQETMAEFIISIIELSDEASNYDINKFVFVDDHTKFIFQNTLFYPVPDDGMKPILCKDDQVCIKILDKYKNGDFVLFEDKLTNKQYIRQIIILGSDIRLLANNQEFESRTLKNDQIQILGKVTDKVTKIS